MTHANVFDHADYRTFLDAWYKVRKATSKTFSHRAFGKRLGSTDPSVLANVIAGRRRIPTERVDGWVAALGLTGDAAAYFALLVRFNNANTREERDRAWAAIAELRARLVEPEIDSSRFLFLSQRLYPTLHALAQCRGWSDDPAAIAARLDPPSTEAEIADALVLLERLGFFARVDGHLVAAEPVVRTSERVTELGSWGYHRQNTRTAESIVERLFDTDAGVAETTAFLGFTAQIPAARIPELRRRMWELQLELFRQCEGWAAEADGVVQFNLQMFPVTRQLSAKQPAPP